VYFKTLCHHYHKTWKEHLNRMNTGTITKQVLVANRKDKG